MANYVEKENFLIRARNYLFPRKGDKTGEIIRKIVFLVGVVVLIASLIILISRKVNLANDTKRNEELSDIFHGNGTTVQITDEKKEQLQKEYPKVMDEFLPLLEINKDVIGWINIPGMYFIDYVVLQGEDNDYYLDHNYMGGNSVSGSIFADYHVPIKPDSQPANIILYGHNMKSGEYFGTLPYYFSMPYTGDISYYKEHPIIEFSTLYEKSTYKIFAGMLTNTEEAAGEVFRYHMVHNFANKSEFDEFCASILDRTSFYNPDVDLRYGDDLLTLSTCMFGGYGGETADPRWVIFARKVRPGEDPNVDVSKAYSNPDPLFYDLFYEIHGGGWGGRKWPAEMIQGYSY